MQKGISSDPKNIDEEYIKIEMIIHKKGITQGDVIDFIKRYNIFGIAHFGIGHNCIGVKEVVITGIESVNEDTEFDEQMDAAVGVKSKIMKEWLDQGQDIMTEMFFKKHPMWIVVTNCPMCGTPNIGFPCKRCGYDH